MSEASQNGPWRFAVIGAGAVAQSRYVPALKRHGDAAVSWIVDVDEARAKEVASETPTAQYATEHAAVLDDVDAAVITTPPKYHESIARDCIEVGVDILTEKPVAVSSEAAKELTERSAERGVQYAISRQYREAPACRLLRALVEQGAVGPVEQFFARFGDETDWDFASMYRITEQLAGGGVMADKGPHLLDVVQWILDAELRVEHYADDSYDGLEANAELLVSVPEMGATGRLEVTGSRSITNGIEIVGKHGRMSAEPDGMSVRIHSDMLEETTVVTTESTTPATTSIDRMNRQVDRFVDSLNAETRSYVPADTGVQILELVEDCYANRSQLAHSWERAAVPDGGR